MALDGDDTHIIQPNGLLDKDSVTEISPDGDADQLADLPLATDRTCSPGSAGWRASPGSLLT